MILRSKTCQESFLVSNVHLFHNAKLDFVKQSQAYFILKTVAQILETNQMERIPVIIAGDFNSFPVSSAMALLHYDSMVKIAQPHSRWSLGYVEDAVRFNKYKNYFTVSRKVMQEKSRFVKTIGQLASAYEQYNVDDY